MKKIRMTFHIVCVTLLLLSFIKVVNGDEIKAVASDQGSVATVASDLEKKREELQQREEHVVELEKKIAERESDLDKKLKELNSVRAGITAAMEETRKNSEEKVVKMVSVFETMQPKAASQVFETLDDWLAVEVLKRMDLKKTAKIMNLMDRNRSAKLSELLTGYYHERNPASAGLAAKESAHGTPSQTSVASEKKNEVSAKEVKKQ